MAHTGGPCAAIEQAPCRSSSLMSFTLACPCFPLLTLQYPHTPHHARSMSLTVPCPCSTSDRGSTACDTAVVYILLCRNPLALSSSLSSTATISWKFYVVDSALVTLESTFSTPSGSTSPSTHNAATAHASTQPSISEFLQLCFTLHTFRRTVPLRLHEDLNDAHCPSDSGNPREVTFADAATQLSFAEFFERCVLSKAVPPRPIPLHQPRDIGTINSPAAAVDPLQSLVRSLTPHHLRLQDSRNRHSWVFHTTSLLKLRPCVPFHTMAPLSPRQTRRPHLLHRLPYSRQVGTHITRSSAAHKRSASTALAGTHLAIGADPRAGCGPYSKPRPVVLPMGRYGLPKPVGLGHLHNADSDLMHHQYRLSILQWNPARRNATQIIAATCGLFHAVILQGASDHVLHVSDQFIAYTGTTDLAILPLLSPTLRSMPFRKLHPVRTRGAGFYSWFTDSCVALLFLALPQSRSAPSISTMSWPQKRDASTDLLRRLHAHTPQHNVDFIGGYFNMSAFSSVGDVFSDPEFSAPSNSSLWRRGALEDSNRECTGFLIMPKRPCEWRVDSHGCYKFNNADIELGPRDTTAHLPLFLHLRTTNFPGLDSITRTEQAQQRRLEREATEHERRQCRRRLTQPPTCLMCQ